MRAQDRDHHQNDHRQHVLYEEPPTATCPAGELSASASISTRISTTVLATAGAIPIHGPRPGVHAETIRTRRLLTAVAGQGSAPPPRIAMALTAIRSLRWKWRPTPNIEQDHPDLGELVRPGSGHPGSRAVCGPISTPAGRYPTIGERRSHWVSNPSTQAAVNPAAIMAAISGNSFT